MLLQYKDNSARVLNEKGERERERERRREGEREREAKELFGSKGMSCVYCVARKNFAKREYFRGKISQVQ